MNFVFDMIRITEELMMKAFLLTFMVSLIFQNQVFASEEQKTGVPVDANCQGSSSDYFEFDFASVLVDDPSNFDRNKAFLAVDKKGRPAVYLLIERQHRCIMLDRHSSTDILAHWGPAQVKDGVYSFSFSYWANGTWRPARVDLQFSENYCSRFRVVSDDTKLQSWLPAGAIPIESDRPPTTGTLKLPLLIGLVEGPRDMPDCSIRPLSDRYRKALQEGKCPLRLRTSSNEGL